MAGDDSREIISKIVGEMKSTTRELFEFYFLPRMERQLDLHMQTWLERIVEKKIEERFVELLRSMNRSATEPQYHEPSVNPPKP